MLRTEYLRALHQFNALMAEWAIHNPHPRREDYLLPEEFKAARIARFKGQIEARKCAIAASGIDKAEKAVMAAYHAEC